jgi:hypothetical protein
MGSHTTASNQLKSFLHTVQAHCGDAGKASTSKEALAAAGPALPDTASVRVTEPASSECTLRSTAFEEQSFAPTCQADVLRSPCSPDHVDQQPFFGRSDLEHVKAQYTKASMVGLRSLPDALQPHFRERLFAELVAIGQAHRQQLRKKMSSNVYAHAANPEKAAALMPLLAHSTKGPPLQTPVCSSHKPQHMNNKFNKELCWTDSLFQPDLTPVTSLSASSIPTGVNLLASEHYTIHILL